VGLPGDYGGNDTVKSAQGLCRQPTTVDIGNVDAVGLIIPSGASCPGGAYATGLLMQDHVDGTMVGLQLTCSDGTKSMFAGGLFGDNGASPVSACHQGDRVVGLYGRSGDVLDALGARCQRANGSVYDAAERGSPDGTESGPADCPDHTELSGVALKFIETDAVDTVTSIHGVCSDAVAPSARLSKVPLGTLSSSLRLSWSGSDDGSGVGHFELRQRTATKTSRFGPWQRPVAWRALTGHHTVATGLASASTYCFSVRAVDHYGNASPWSNPRCTAVGVDDRKLHVSQHWKLATGRRWWNKTATVSSTQGAEARFGSRLDRVGVVATLCPTCGNISIYVGAKKIGSISLHSASTRYQRILMLPRFHLRSATVTVRVDSHGKSVQLDGLISSRS
jgi:hypothetical protein